MHVIKTNTLSFSLIVSLLKPKALGAILMHAERCS
jgi:hypothetical protein